MRVALRRLVSIVFGVGLLSAIPMHGAESVDPARFEREVLVTEADDPISLDVAPDGRVFFVERRGKLKVWDPRTRTVATLAAIPTHVAWDTGMLAVLLARDFAQTGHLYVLRCPEDQHLVMRVARFTVAGGRVDLSSETRVLEWAIEGEEPPHCGGGLGWDAEGNLLIGTGDNTPPQDVPAFDPSPGKERFDARRSAANSRDLRGKVLRVRVGADGKYGIPSGNLFPNGEQGRPEIFAMGVRNAFRVAAHPKTGWIIWGDVGGNVETSLGLGPEGYDEINVAKGPGFFGWPFMSGANEAWRPFDPATKKPAGAPFDPARVVNDSRGNTGLRDLPPAVPAMLYYPTVASSRWPELGAGGRSITSGPFYDAAAFRGSDLRLPDTYDGVLFFAEWMRNWIYMAHLTPEGALAKLEPFMPGTVFRKPSDLKVGPEGALYVVEFGDRFGDNRDGQIVRCVYRRGNRPPVANIVLDRSAGRIPLQVTLDAAGSRDPDGDALRHRWKLPNGQVLEGARASYTFNQSGRWIVELEVTDPSGLKSATRAQVIAGNEPPKVAFESPVDGDFLDAGKPVVWRVAARDEEDGVLPAEKVLVQVERRDRRVEDVVGKAATHPGLALMRAGTCFACHSATEKSAGPTYLAVAQKYATNLDARERLARKVMTGGLGVWGPIPMPPHPQHNLEQARQMIDWVLALANRQAVTLPAGLAGDWVAPRAEGRGGGLGEGAYVFTAAATDRGAGGLTPLRAESSVVLRTRRQRAAHFDSAFKTVYQDNLGEGLVARTQVGGWIGYERIRTERVNEILVTGRPSGVDAICVELRLDKPDGEEVGAGVIRAPAGRRMEPVTLKIRPGTEGIRNLYVVVRACDGNGAGGAAELLTLEFR